MSRLVARGRVVSSDIELTRDANTRTALRKCLLVMLRMIPEACTGAGLKPPTDKEHGQAIKAAAIALYGHDRSAWPLAVQRAANGQYP